MSQKCEQVCENGRSCGQWAVRGSDPPHCWTHGGRALLPEPERVMCAAACADGTPCQRFAIQGSDPPRCVSHGGCKEGGKIGAPSGPRNGMWKHGAYEGLTKEFTTIDDLIDDLMEKQARLSALLDRVRDVREAMMLVSLHSQNAARLGKLMLNKKALAKDARDEFEEALNDVLEELTEELGLKLG
ncbi:MAG: hypothetical protein E3J21_21295 [Anaerolineales bacterium]|nr:MAG: hypothetical protein E3J21_21295 [Anaerolineales bacterium]